MIKVQFFRCKFVKTRKAIQRFKTGKVTEFANVEDVVQAGKWLETTFRKGETLQWKFLNPVSNTSLRPGPTC